jgi:uncharacterized membrane protein YgcG
MKQFQDETKRELERREKELFRSREESAAIVVTKSGGITQSENYAYTG